MLFFLFLLLSTLLGRWRTVHTHSHTMRIVSSSTLLSSLISAAVVAVRPGRAEHTSLNLFCLLPSFLPTTETGHPKKLLPPPPSQFSPSSDGSSGEKTFRLRRRRRRR